MEMKITILVLILGVSLMAAAIEWKATVGQEGRLRWEHGVENANSIRWERDKRQIAYWADGTFKLEPGYNLTSGESWTTLVINNVTKDDAGNYTCQANIIFGPPEATGRVAGHLQVEGDGDEDNHPGTNLGSLSHGTQLPTTDLSSYGNTLNLCDRTDQKTRTTYHTLQEMEMKITILVLILGVSLMAAAIEWKATVGQEGRLRWEHGVENANSIRWERDKRQIAYWADGTFKLEPGYNLTSGESWTTLVINNVTKDDAGNYTCQANIIFGPPEATGRVAGHLQVEDARLPDSGSTVHGSLFTGLLMGGGALLLVTLLQP
ncbi:uncharacterized protein LOC115173876 [Salmo trutta]|uniref:uncharacterized protein LOC115173876 n=1 Tax=Salmo trutta TaxID=8032 RepID=UPI0011314274|nr:uncharacterized protein LOC115173876 [Salmo trutta]